MTKDYQGKSQTILIKEKISGKNLFKVLLGPFINTQNAKNVADNLLELGYNSFVITLKE